MEIINSIFGRGKKTYSQKPGVLSLFNPLLTELQGLLKVLTINCILNLLVPSMEHGVVRHFPPVIQWI
jgi:hypothetical protein